MSFEILDRFSRAVIYSSATANDITSAVLEVLAAARASLAGANLTRADLTGANLTDASLTDANLTRANLTRASLTRADLTDADLTDADLTGANLTRADLTRASLTRADLTGANLTDASLTDASLTDASLTDASLTGANLTRADLTGANLTDASLTDASLTPIRDDFWAVLCASPKEVFGLREALVNGRINGTVYEGPCACLVGTIANLRHCNYQEVPGLAPNSGRPAERFFIPIHPGHNPENSQHAKLAIEWIDEFIANMRGAFTPTEEVPQ